MVFGWRISAAAWEAYHRAIMSLAEPYFDNVELVAKYQNYLDLLEWDEPIDEVVDFVQANRDKFNQGVLDTVLEYLSKNNVKKQSHQLLKGHTALTLNDYIDKR